MIDSNDIIDFVNKKLKNELEMLDLSIWNNNNAIESLKNQIKDKKEQNKYLKKQIAMLEHSINILEGKKDNVN